jgi:hypothetical protein
METTIVINKIEQKISAAGKPYFIYDTNVGKMACWDAVIAETLKSKLNVPIGVEIAEKGDFKNIKKLLKTPVAEVPGQGDKFAEARAQKNTTMYVSYAKDLMVVGIPAEKAVEMIKSAIKEFE